MVRVDAVSGAIAPTVFFIKKAHEYVGLNRGIE
jgi:hypothetical protein